MEIFEDWLTGRTYLKLDVEDGANTIDGWRVLRRNVALSEFGFGIGRKWVSIAHPGRYRFRLDRHIVGLCGDCRSTAVAN